MYRENTVAVIIPAYNEEDLIAPTLNGVPEWVDRIIIIDDGSKDGTLNAIKECIHFNPRITLIQHKKNQGVGAAIASGYKVSLSEGIRYSVVMAGDNQMDPQYIPKLLEPLLKNESDYTKGNRLITTGYREGMSRWRFIGNAVLSFLTKIASGYWQLMDPQNGFTAITIEALNTIDLDNIYSYYGYCNDLLVKLNVYGFRTKDIPIPARYGNEKSKIRYAPYILKVSWMLLRNFFWRLKMKYLVLSFNPIILFYFLGLLISPVSIGLGLYSLYHKFVLGGNLFIRGVLSLLLFIIGLQFLSFAMLFDMQMETTKQPRIRGHLPLPAPITDLEIEYVE